MPRLYVGGLPEGIEREQLTTVFEPFGKIEDVWIARKPSGFAFVQYGSQQECHDAVKAVDGTEHFGGTLKVEFSNRSDRSNGGRRRSPPRGDRERHRSPMRGPPQSSYRGRSPPRYREPPRHASPPRYRDPLPPPSRGSYRQSPPRYRSPPRSSYSPPRRPYGSAGGMPPPRSPPRYGGRGSPPPVFRTAGRSSPPPPSYRGGPPPPRPSYDAPRSSRDFGYDREPASRGPPSSYPPPRPRSPVPYY